ncbi:MAG TPA: hypothetical protein VF819_07070 [Nitrospira sp.]
MLDEVRGLFDGFDIEEPENESCVGEWFAELDRQRTGAPAEQRSASGADGRPAHGGSDEGCAKGFQRRRDRAVREVRGLPTQNRRHLNFEATPSQERLSLGKS